jgi:fructose-1,6-bisphosphatase/inositol monophosphatase family enzyme
MTHILPNKKTATLILPNTHNVSIKILLDAKETAAWTDSSSEGDDPKVLHERLCLIGNSLKRLIKEGQPHVKSTEKTGPHDMVTEMDKGIELLFRTWLSDYYPHHKVIGEEYENKSITTSDIVWHIDPIDGTANYVEGSSQVAIHLGCVKDGKPWVSYVGLPFFNKTYSGFFSSEMHAFPKINYKNNAVNVFGTEYLPHRKIEDTLFKKVCEKKGASPYQAKSIGYTILQLLEGNVSAFYKPRIKPWDMIAPLEILWFNQKDNWDIELFIPSQKNSQTWISVSPFDNSEETVSHINSELKKDVRIGHLVITKKNETDLKEYLIRKMMAIDE